MSCFCTSPTFVTLTSCPYHPSYHLRISDRGSLLLCAFSYMKLSRMPLLTTLYPRRSSSLIPMPSEPLTSIQHDHAIHGTIHCASCSGKVTAKRVERKIHHFGHACWQNCVCVPLLGRTQTFKGSLWQSSHCSSTGLSLTCCSKVYSFLLLVHMSCMRYDRMTAEYHLLQ